MPEGDTIHRTARTLERVLSGSVIEEVEAPGFPAAAALCGRRVTAVESHGKHLLLRFEGGWILHTHLGMHGAWYVGKRDRPVRKRTGPRRIVLKTREAEAVCVRPARIEIAEEGAARSREALRSLGPDLCAPSFDGAEAVRRLAARRGMTIAEALLDQTAVAGIGNVYKCEVLFLERVDPFARAEELPVDVLERLVHRARELLLANLAGWPRVTRAQVPGGRHWVYRRKGRPCYRCRTPIAWRRHGDPPRSTYWCPSCQAVAGGGPP